MAKQWSPKPLMTVQFGLLLPVGKIEKERCYMFYNEQEKLIEEIMKKLSTNEESLQQHFDEMMQQNAKKEVAAKETKENKNSVGNKMNENTEIRYFKIPGIAMSDLTLKRVGNIVKVDGSTVDEYRNVNSVIHDSFTLAEDRVVKDIRAKLRNGILYFFITYENKNNTVAEVIKID